MKVSHQNKVNWMRLIKGIAALFAMSLSGGMAFATSDTTISNLGTFQSIITNNAGTIYTTTIVVATLAGLILIIKGLVHLKQNYTGSGQEKHLSKGVASLVFGVLLILAVPISHMLTGTVDSSVSYNTGAGNVDFGSVSA